MIGYIIDSDGFFVGKHICQKNPLAQGEEDQYLFPPNVIFVEPPKKAPPENKVYRFNGTAWKAVDDPNYLAMLEEQKRQSEKIAEELAERQKALDEIAKIEEQAVQAQIVAQQKRAEREIKLQTAKAKLSALGLTDDEIQAMIGV